MRKWHGGYWKRPRGICGWRWGYRNRSPITVRRAGQAPPLNLALIYRHNLQPKRAAIIILWADDSVVAVLFHDMGGPAGDAGDGEDRGVEIDWDAHSVVGAGAEEIDVGVLVLQLFDDGDKSFGHFVPLGVAGGLAEL